MERWSNGVVRLGRLQLTAMTAFLEAFHFLNS
jgi:hypothetical protein